MWATVNRCDWFESASAFESAFAEILVVERKSKIGSFIRIVNNTSDFGRSRGWKKFEDISTLSVNDLLDGSLPLNRYAPSPSFAPRIMCPPNHFVPLSHWTNLRSVTLGQPATDMGHKTLLQLFARTIMFFTRLRLVDRFEDLSAPFVQPCQGAIAWMVKGMTPADLSEDSSPAHHFDDVKEYDYCLVGLSVQELVAWIEYGRLVRGPESFQVFNSDPPIDSWGCVGTKNWHTVCTMCQLQKVGGYGSFPMDVAPFAVMRLFRCKTLQSVALGTRIVAFKEHWAEVVMIGFFADLFTPKNLMKIIPCDIKRETVVPSWEIVADSGTLAHDVRRLSSPSAQCPAKPLPFMLEWGPLQPNVINSSPELFCCDQRTEPRAMEDPQA